MKKGWLIGCGIAVVMFVVCGGIGAMIVTGVMGIFALTQPVVDASEDFLKLLGQGKTAEAYAATAEGFRAQQSEVSFHAAVKQLGLSEFTSVSWQNRQINNQDGSAAGTVTTRGGATKPVSMQLIKEADQWKVVGVRYGGVDLISIKAILPIPADAELKRMTTQSLLDFNESVKAKDFNPFYDKLSNVWKKETTPQQLQGVFQVFIDKNIDIAPIRTVALQFAPPPRVDDKGVLVVSGQYPTTPSRVRFNLEYVHDPAGWKLIAFQVNVGKDRP